MIYVESDHGPGTVGISCGELARYTEFGAHFERLQVPERCAPEIPAYGIGYDTASNSNDIIRQMLPHHEWVFILDDDHTFKSDLLLKLLDRRVDCIVPLYMQRKAPFWPVAYRSRNPDGACTHVTFEDMAGKTGMLPIVSAGKSGVLIRRPVIAKLAGGDCVCPAPAEGERREHAACPWQTATWFEHVGRIGEDHTFFARVLTAGFQLFCDLDNWMEHLTTFKVRPYRDPKTGAWCAEVHLYNEVNMKLWVSTPPAGG